MFEDIIKPKRKEKEFTKEKNPKEWPALSKDTGTKPVWKILWKKSVRDDLKRAYES